MIDIWDNRCVGHIVEWPGGFAMTLYADRHGSAVRCCPGHPTPEDAKTHGLVRLGEVASKVADCDIALWAESEQVSA